MIEDGKKTKKKAKKAAVFLFISIVFIILLAGGGYLYIKSELQPVSPESKQQKLVEIPSGSTSSRIADILESEGMIKNASVFKYYVKYKKESGFIAGTYRLSPSMDVPKIISIIKSGKVTAAVTLTIPEGTQLKEIAQIIAKNIHKRDKDIFNQLNDRSYIKGLITKYPTVLSPEIVNSRIMYPLEGYLYPATYSFYKPNPTVDEIITAMLDKTKTVLDSYQAQIKKKQLTNHQLLTMASLIEEEATNQADRSKIASVFYNRIQKGMPLQTDPTVLYAQGKHKARVLYQDLEVDSPYNTYKNNGLPPGPIANAGKSSIKAALNPASTEYYYFLAASDGTVIFSKTLEEHNQVKAKYISSNK